MIDISRLKACQALLDKGQCSKTTATNHIFNRLFDTQLNLIVRDILINKFWSNFSEDPKGAICYESFLYATQILQESCDQIETTFNSSIYKPLKDKFYFALKTQILSSKPCHLDDYLNATYFRAFKAFINLEKLRGRHEFPSDQSSEDKEIQSDHSDLEDDYEEFEIPNNSKQIATCPGCRCTSDLCSCETLYHRFSKANEILRRLDILEHLVGDVVMNITRLFIERKVTIRGKTSYSQSYLHELTIWVDKFVSIWISGIYGMTDLSELDSIGTKLDRFLRDAYADIRVSHMFEIIIEYPNSEAAIQDLKICLEQSTSSDFRMNLIDSVKQSLIESLLHAGVNTYDILTAYISAIKALRALDPTGLILQLVTEPVRRYLKSREDTVRCIVTALTDEDQNSELNREMIKGSQVNENSVDGKGGTIEMNLPNEGEKCTYNNFGTWKPDPIKLNSSDEVMKSSRFSDIVSILVNIYETKDLFVEEYQKLLSQRLLNKYEECNLDIELRNLELLTMRFSDCELHRCEVMLKDVQTSKRINKRILSGDIREHRLEDFKNMDVLIVSSPFWPEKFSPMASLSDDPPEIQFPPEIESAMKTYTKAFESIQASRTLHWRHHLGSVNLDLTIDGKTQNFTVTPLHASILYLFKEKKSWKLQDLMHRTSLPAATLRSRLALWHRNGIIRDSGGDKYDLIQ